MPTIISGLVVYFDRSLGANLLYRFERPQFAEVKKNTKTGQKVIVGQEKEVSVVYGAEHLLRMLGTFEIPVNDAMHGAYDAYSQSTGYDCAIEFGPGECGACEGLCE